jgi:energy-coupling factor transporter ATP-binding protein EcfA2
MPAAPASNPFATRFTRPGAIDFIFPEGESHDAQIDRLRKNDWRGQILGPHGSGKSTLLASLEPALREIGREVVMHTLTAGQRKLDLPTELDSDSILVIDGFEQLSWWSRRKVQAACRRAGAGLLISAHTDLGLPTIFQTQPNLELARQLVSRLLPPGDRTISESDIAAAYARHPHNLRELLFSLFDLHQARSAGTLGRES